LVTHGRWFSQGTPASSATKACHHDLADILLKVALNTKNQNQTIKLQTFIRKRKQYFTWVHPSIK
jgi:hypothetical protein